jgi:hypothetical protein
MPSEIQARITYTIDTAIDTRISPVAMTVHKEVAALSADQKTSFKLIEGLVRDGGNNTEAKIQKHTQEITLALRNKFNTLSSFNEAYSETIGKIAVQAQKTLESVQNHAVESRAASTTVQGIIADLSARQSQSTMVLRRVLQTGQEAAYSIQRHSSISREQTLSLHQKLDRMNWLMGTVKDRVGALSSAQQSAKLDISNSEIRNAIANIQRNVWLVVSALHVLIRELM